MPHLTSPSSTPDAAVVAPLIVPNSNEHGTRFFSRVLDRSVHSTISNTPYASVSNVDTAKAGPHALPVVCECGRSNPDNCVRFGEEMTAPYLDSHLSKHYMVSGFRETDAAQDKLGPIETYLRNRVAPMPPDAVM